jgi:diguanylate cyclase (GGDEF)-like protein/PAS domain S-box-containing protein
MASARFEDLFHGMPFPCFSVDANGTVFEWNEAASHMFGVPGHEIIQKPIYGRFLSLDNDFLLKGLVSEAFKGHHLSNIELVAICPGGHRQLLVSVFPLKASRQEPTAALIACADITPQKDAEQRARSANEKVGAILDSIKDAFVTVDRDLRYRYVNNTAAEWLGLDPKQIIGKSLTEISPDLKGSDFIERIGRLTESEEGESFEHYFEEARVWLEFRVYPSEEGVSIFYNDITVRKSDEDTIRRQREQLEMTMLKLNDNTVLLEQQRLELEEANANLQKLATTDGLTGLRNHRAMQDALTLTVQGSARKKLPVSVALLDVDHFKKFNDSFGHQAGDVVLREVARILSESVREGDIVARYGGEEFCVILPDTNEADALVVCERIRASVEGAPWVQRPVTISVGVSTAVDVHDTQEFIKQADEALYEAKAGGRNCVKTYRAGNYRCA